MKTLKFENVRVLRDSRLIKTSLWVQDGKIIDPERRFWNARSSELFLPDEIIDGDNCIIAPGFIDVQINGAFGIDFSDPSITPEQILQVSQGLTHYGVTSYCPTLVSLSAEKYRQLLPKYTRTTNGAEQMAANILGLHLEGPFINHSCKGAHDATNLLAPSKGFSSVLNRYGGNLENVSIITLAPELQGATETISELRKRNIVASIGHSCASIHEALAACEAGATMITHMFNAMTPFHHRDPGIVGLLGKTGHRPFYGLILDGIHSHQTSCNIAMQTHPDGLVLVTDAMAGMGLEAGKYQLGGQDVVIRSDKKATLDGTDTIAGSVITLDQCVRQLCHYTGCSLMHALECASFHPAQVLGIEKIKGSLSCGADADFVLVNDELQIMETYIAGTRVYQAKF